MFLNWLHTLSSWEIGLLFAVGGLLLAVVLPIYIRDKYALKVPDEMGAGALDAYKILLGLTIALAVFSLVRVQSTHLGLQDTVAREAHIITKLNRDLLTMSTHEAEAFRDDLNTYANLVVYEEWPAMVSGERSPKVTELVLEMTQGLRAIEAKTYPQQVARAEVLATFKQMVDVRDTRLADFKKHLPGYMWVILSCLITMLIITAWFEKRVFFTIAFTTATILAVAVLITLLVDLDGVLVGDSRITPEPIINVLPELVKPNPRLDS